MGFRALAILLECNLVDPGTIPISSSGPMQCEYTKTGCELQTMKTMHLSELNNSVEYHMIRFVFLFILKEWWYINN